MAAFAADDPVTIDGKHILVTDVSESGFGNKQIHSSVYNGGGVYIIAGSVDQRFPNAEKAIAELFKAHGIAVADSLETSSVAMVFNTLGALELAKADQEIAYSAAPNANQVATGGAQLVTAVMSTSGKIAGGGATGVVGFVAGALFNSDSKLVISVQSFQKPEYTKGFGGRGVQSTIGWDGIKHGVAKVFYKLEKGKEASDDVVLKMAVDQWIKHYMIFDAPTLQAATPAAPVVQAFPPTNLNQ